MPDPAVTATAEDLGEQLRHVFGIDGTMGDAQDIPHPFVGITYCLACGLAKPHPMHESGGKVAAELRQPIRLDGAP